VGKWTILELVWRCGSFCFPFLFIHSFKSDILFVATSHWTNNTIKDGIMCNCLLWAVLHGKLHFGKIRRVHSKMFIMSVNSLWGFVPDLFIQLSQRQRTSNTFIRDCCLFVVFFHHLMYLSSKWRYYSLKITLHLCFWHILYKIVYFTRFLHM
jgi:hypothetical protein